MYSGHITEFAISGLHIVNVLYAAFKKMVGHPLIDEGGKNKYKEH